MVTGRGCQALGYFAWVASVAWQAGKSRVDLDSVPWSATNNWEIGQITALP